VRQKIVLVQPEGQAYRWTQRDQFTDHTRAHIHIESVKIFNSAKILLYDSRSEFSELWHWYSLPHLQTRRMLHTMRRFCTRYTLYVFHDHGVRLQRK